MTHEAELVRGKRSISPDESQLGLCVYREGWHQGVVGIVAGRLKDRFARPAIAFADAGADRARRTARIGALDSGRAHPRRARCDRDALSRPDSTLRRPRDGGGSVDSAHPPRSASPMRSRPRSGSWVSARRDRRDHSQRRRTAIGANSNCRWPTKSRAVDPWGQGFPEPLFHGDFDVDQSTRRRRTPSETVAARRTRRVVDAIAFNQRAARRRATRAQVAYRLVAQRLPRSRDAAARRRAHRPRMCES